MKTLFKAEKAVRKTVFTSIWKFFGVKDLTDLGHLAIFTAATLAAIVIVLKSL